MTGSRPAYEWCVHRECWVHQEVCRSNAYQKGIGRCLSCRQLSLFDPEEISILVRGKRGKGASFRSAGRRGRTRRRGSGDRPE